MTMQEDGQSLGCLLSMAVADDYNDWSTMSSQQGGFEEEEERGREFSDTNSVRGAASLNSR